MAKRDLRLGIDVGGTNTDAVVLDNNDEVLAKIKVPTSEDVSTGIENAIAGVLNADDVPTQRVTHVMLGTTHATNAILERRHLQRVAVVRIGGPATYSIPPLSTWPDDLRSAVSAGEVIIDGGIEFNGQELAPFDGDSLRDFLVAQRDEIDAVAITSVFSPVSDRHEQEARKITNEVLGPDVPISLGSEIGSVGLLERENATVLNATLIGVAHRVSNALTEALARHGISPVTFFAQNDGTLMALDYVIRYPVLTIGSGPANSMRGAAYLTGLQDVLIADVGGTSTDVGVLSNGFPRVSATPIEIGGVRTNFRMPDLIAIALGGGTIITRNDDDGAVTVAAQSVGYRVTEEALVFGGETFTMTDAAVCSGRIELGTSSIGDGGLFGETAERALAKADEMIAGAVDRIKTSRTDRDLVAVGGGSFLIPDELAGVKTVHRPEHHEVANAIGAAIAAVSGQIDRLFQLDSGGREAALAEAKEMARNEAIRAGADPEHVEIVDVEEITMAYMANPVLRIRAKAAGPLSSL